MNPDDLKTFRNVHLSPEAKRRIARNLDKAPKNSYVEPAQPHSIRMVLTTVAACAVATVGIGCIWVLQANPPEVLHPADSAGMLATGDIADYFGNDFYIRDTNAPDEYLFLSETQRQAVRTLLLSESWTAAEPFDLHAADADVDLSECVRICMTQDGQPDTQEAAEAMPAGDCYLFNMDAERLYIDIVHDKDDPDDNECLYYKMPHGMKGKLRKLLDQCYVENHPECDGLLTKEQLLSRSMHCADYIDRISGTVSAGNDRNNIQTDYTFSVDLAGERSYWSIRHQGRPEPPFGSDTYAASEHDIHIDFDESNQPMGILTMQHDPFLRLMQYDEQSRYVPQYAENTVLFQITQGFAQSYLSDTDNWIISSTGECNGRSCYYAKGKAEMQFLLAIDEQTGLVLSAETFDEDGGLFDWWHAEVQFGEDAAPVTYMTAEMLENLQTTLEQGDQADAAQSAFTEEDKNALMERMSEASQHFRKISGHSITRICQPGAPYTNTLGYTEFCADLTKSGFYSHAVAYDMSTERYIFEQLERDANKDRMEMYVSYNADTGELEKSSQHGISLPAEEHLLILTNTNGFLTTYLWNDIHNPDMTWEITGTELYEGRRCYVVNVTGLEPNNTWQIVSIEAKIDAETGLVLYDARKDENGQITHCTAYTDLLFDEAAEPVPHSLENSDYLAMQERYESQQGYPSFLDAPAGQCVTQAQSIMAEHQACRREIRDSWKVLQGWKYTVNTYSSFNEPFWFTEGQQARVEDLLMNADWEYAEDGAHTNLIDGRAGQYVFNVSKHSDELRYSAESLFTLELDQQLLSVTQTVMDEKEGETTLTVTHVFSMPQGFAEKFRTLMDDIFQEGPGTPPAGD